MVSLDYSNYVVNNIFLQFRRDIIGNLRRILIWQQRCKKRLSSCKRFANILVGNFNIFIISVVTHIHVRI